MWNKKEQGGGGRKLSWEIVEYIFLSACITAFSFCFLYFTSQSIADAYLEKRGILLRAFQESTLRIWITGICAIAASVIFTLLFLFLLGQRISYLLEIIKGVGALSETELDASIPLDGDDEFTRLAETINFLAASQKMLREQERALSEEREQLIRSLSHDIRTPLTSIIAYSQYMSTREDAGREDVQNYISLIQTKSEQIRLLTDQLLGKETEGREKTDDVRLLMEQLAAEWEEMLEEQFACVQDFSGCEVFSGCVNISEMRRIFDNLVSNVEKYADPAFPVRLAVENQGSLLTIRQSNHVYQGEKTGCESHGIGLDSIRKIAESYGGEVNIQTEHDRFTIEITFRIL